MNTWKFWLAGVLVIAFAVLMFGGMFMTKSNIKELASVQVTSYNGTVLDSITDFPQNAIKGTQYINISTYKLHIGGMVDKPLDLTYDSVLKNPKYSKVVQLDCVEGWSERTLWEGVLVRDIIKPAKVMAGANTIIFKAVDGYSTSFPIDYVMKNDIIMAFKVNNVTLPNELGYPFILVAESKWGYKWARWITEIELSNDTNYKGYWESNGYSNSGDLNQSFYE